MADLPTRSDLVRVGRTAALQVIDGPIPAKEFDRAGSDANLLLNLAALMGEEVTQEMALALRDLFASSAVGPGLDKLLFDRYGITRKPAARAVVTLNFSRATVTGGAGTLVQGLRAQTAGGVVFALDQAVQFTSVALTASGTATALVAGLQGNVPAGAITRFVDPIFDTTIVVTNSAVAAGGADPETDRDFSNRSKQFLPTLRRGIAAAIEFGARQVPGVQSAKATEMVNPSGTPAAIVELFILDASGGSNDVLEQSVRDQLLEFRALGIPVIVDGGTVVNQPITIDLSFAAGFDSLAAAQKAKDAITAVVNDLDIGETLFVSSIIAAAKSVPGVIIASGGVTVPVSDVVPTASQAIRTSQALITIV